MSTPSPSSKSAASSGTVLPLRARLLGSVIVAAVIAASLLGNPILERLEYQIYDWVMATGAVHKVSPNVVLVTVDEEAVHDLGRWPWPREVLARLVDRLDAVGAQTIAFTMAFLEPDKGGIRGLASQLNEALAKNNTGPDAAAVQASINKLMMQVDPDTAFGDAIRRAEADVILGYFFHLTAREFTVDLAPDEVERRSKMILPAAMLSPLPGSPKPTLAVAQSPQPPIPPLASATESMGFLRFPVDRDGAVRQALLAIEYDGRYYPSLALEAVWAFLGKPYKGMVASDDATEGVALGKNRFIASDEASRILLQFPGKRGAYPTYSIAAVLRGDVPEEALRNKLILVGVTAKGLGNHRRTPVHELTPDLEVHAAVAENLLAGRSLSRPSWYGVIDVFFIFVVGCLSVAGFGRLGALFDLALLGGTIVVYHLFSVWMLLDLGMVITLVGPPVAAILVFGFLTLLRYRAAENKRAEIEQTFGRYVAPAVIEQMAKNPEQLRLGGEERVITVLFSDLKGFTAASEALGPTKMVELMCEYFEEMTAKIYEHDGLLKEYVGDEIMAIFGAPLEAEDHAVRACRAALAMRDRLAVLAAEWVEEGRPPLSARWGVNSGPMLVGNLGSSYRYAYGALGDNVNLGSRLEGLNGQYGTELLIGENTEKLVRGQFHLRELDTVQVKGKSEGVRIFELLAPIQDDLDPIKAKAYVHYSVGLIAYREGRFLDAQQAFAAVSDVLPEDGPTKVLAERCFQYQTVPPAKDWGGVFTATKK